MQVGSSAFNLSNWTDSISQHSKSLVEQLLYLDCLAQIRRLLDARNAEKYLVKAEYYHECVRPAHHLLRGKDIGFCFPQDSSAKRSYLLNHHHGGLHVLR